MAKLYFKFGAMGSSKTANALMTKFNYEEKGKKVWLIKPAIDNRDGQDVLKSRIGLQAKAVVIQENDSILELAPLKDIDVIICDECQFLTPKQVFVLLFWYCDEFAIHSPINYQLMYCSSHGSVVPSKCLVSPL